jgi:hypothetical protein
VFMRLETATLPSHLRVFAAMMLWVWLVSQSFCVAHCHGLLGEALVYGMTPEGTAKSFHGCCARPKTAQRTQFELAAQQTSSSQSASQNSDSQSPNHPCSPQAVIQGGLNLETPTWAPVTLPFPFSEMDPGFPCAFSISRQLQAAAVEPRWSEQAVPRWDAGFEPSVILGSGLRSLAPPVGV